MYVAFIAFAAALSLSACDESVVDQGISSTGSPRAGISDGFLNITDLRAGDIGKLPYAFDPSAPRACCVTKVAWIIGDTTTALDVHVFSVAAKRAEQRANDYPQLEKTGTICAVVRGTPVNAKTGDEVRLTGRFKVTGTTKAIRSARPGPIYVLELETMPALIAK